MEAAFRRQPGLVGRSLRLNGEPYTVIGVLPPAFLPWEGIEYVVPIVFRSEQLELRANHWLRVVGRLKPGVDPAQAHQDLVAVSRPYRPLYPKWKENWGITVRPMPSSSRATSGRCCSCSSARSGSCC